MTQYILRRIVLMIPTLIGVSMLVVGFVRLLPGDAVDILVSENVVGGGQEVFRQYVDEQLRAEGIDPATASAAVKLEKEREILGVALRERGIDPETATAAQRNDARRRMTGDIFRDRIREKLGLDRSYIEQWWDWTSNAVRGDLGTHITGGRQVSTEIKDRLPVSFQLGMYGIIFGTIIAIPIGVLSAVKQDTWSDFFARSFAISMLAIPNFFLATMVIIFASRWFGYSFPFYYKSFFQSPSENSQVMLVAGIILGGSLAGTIMRLMRTTMLEILRQDYIRTARAKGVRERVVIIQHAVRNALLPVVTLIGLQVPVIIGGSLVIEVIFGIPGVSFYLYRSLLEREFPAIIAVNMVIAIAIVVVNLLVDVTYAYLDPRIKFG